MYVHTLFAMAVGFLLRLSPKPNRDKRVLSQDHEPCVDGSVCIQSSSAVTEKSVEGLRRDRESWW